MMEQTVQKSRNLSKMDKNGVGEEGVTNNEMEDSQKPICQKLLIGMVPSPNKIQI